MTKPSAVDRNRERVYRMSFGTVYPLYVRKAEDKGRTKEEVDRLIPWPTGYLDKLVDELAKGRAMEKVLRG